MLLAEDAPDNQRLMSMVLRKAGAEVITVDNGQVACEAAMEAWRGDSAVEAAPVAVDASSAESTGWSAPQPMMNVVANASVAARSSAD